VGKPQSNKAAGMRKREGKKKGHKGKATVHRENTLPERFTVTRHTESTWAWDSNASGPVAGRGRRGRGKMKRWRAEY